MLPSSQRNGLCDCRHHYIGCGSGVTIDWTLVSLDISNTLRLTTSVIPESYIPEKSHLTSTFSPELNNHVQIDVNYASTLNSSHQSDPTNTSSSSAPIWIDTPLRGKLSGHYCISVGSLPHSITPHISLHVHPRPIIGSNGWPKYCIRLLPKNYSSFTVMMAYQFPQPYSLARCPPINSNAPPITVGIHMATKNRVPSFVYAGKINGASSLAITVAESQLRRLLETITGDTQVAYTVGDQTFTITSNLIMVELLLSLRIDMVSRLLDMYKPRDVQISKYWH